MKTINKILVPTDFSQGARAAYDHANHLAAAYGSKIDLIHFIPTFRYFKDSLKKLGMPFSMEKDFIPQVMKDTDKTLAEEMEKYVRKEHRGEFLSRIGPNVAEAICDFAKQKKYDLILMGSQGNSAEQYITLGSITSRVIKISQTPVMAVPEKPAPEKISNIIVPTDYSDESLQALKKAGPIAAKTGARITFIHVLELYGAISEAHAIPVSDKSVLSVRDTILTKIKGFLTVNEEFNMRLNLEASGNHIVYTDNNGESSIIPVEMVIERGVSAHYEIVSYANEHADLLVISTHGRSGLAHMMLGSTAEKVVQWADVPVLTTRIRFNS